MKKRFLAVLLSFIMIFSLLPMNALAAESPEPQDAVAAETVAENEETGKENDADKDAPAEAIRTVVIKPQLWEWYFGIFSRAGERASVKVSYVCQRCLTDVYHFENEKSNHTALISELAKSASLMQDKANDSWGDVVVVGLSKQHNDDNNKKEHDVHSFDEKGTIEVNTAGWLYYLAVPVSGKINVSSKSDSIAHTTQTYNLRNGEFTVKETGINEENQFTCLLTFKNNKAFRDSYISKYNKEYPDCTHTDASPVEEGKEEAITVVLHSKNVWNDRINSWTTEQ